MSAHLDFTMELDLLESLDEPTLPLVLLDSLDVAKAPSNEGQVSAVVIAANAGAPFITGGRMIRTTPPGPPPRRMAHGTEQGVPLVGSRMRSR